jgi:hypothetical protein
LEVGLSLHPALAPQKFLNFLRGVRAIRSAERPLARDEWPSHRGSILGRDMLLLLLAPQGQSSWGAELSRGAVCHSRRSLDLVRTEPIGLIDLGRGRKGAYRVHAHVHAADTLV